MSLEIFSCVWTISIHTRQIILTYNQIYNLIWGNRHLRNMRVNSRWLAGIVRWYGLEVIVWAVEYVWVEQFLEFVTKVGFSQGICSGSPVSEEGKVTFKWRYCYHVSYWAIVLYVKHYLLLRLLMLLMFLSCHITVTTTTNTIISTVLILTILISYK